MTRNLRRFIIIALLLFIAILGWKAQSYYQQSKSKHKIIESYVNGTSSAYAQLLKEAQALSETVDFFLEQPNEETLRLAREAWLRAHSAYVATEITRFVAPESQEKGKNAQRRLDEWPISAAAMDYMDETDTPTLVGGEEPITKELLLTQEKADQSKLLGFHAIEFLLWGEDARPDGPGDRPYSDYAENNTQRRDYLKAATEILLEDIQTLNDSWQAGTKDNSAGKFLQLKKREALRQIFSGLIFMSERELANRNMQYGLENGAETSEQCSFSDTSNEALVQSFQGIKNVYYANYGLMSGFGPHAMLERKDPGLAKEISDHISQTEELMEAIPSPIDTEVFGSLQGSPGRYKMELAIRSLKELADDLRKAVDVLKLSKGAGKPDEVEEED